MSGTREPSKFEYRPTKTKRSYRIVVLRKMIVEAGVAPELPISFRLLDAL